MSWPSALITLTTGVLLPTVDVYSDIAFAIKLVNFRVADKYIDRCTYDPNGPDGHVSHQKYAATMLTPPIISWLFVAYQWFKYEVGRKQKLMTLPFLLLQVYPQWRALRVLYCGRWKLRRGWQIMKEEWETEICNLGKSLNSPFLRESKGNCPAAIQRGAKKISPV